MGEIVHMIVGIDTVRGIRRLVTFVMVLAIAASTPGNRSLTQAQQKRMGRAIPKPPAAKKGGQMSSGVEPKEIAGGPRSGVIESFVMVARDPQTYASLRTLYAALPEQEPDYFSSHVVVAAFTGQRRTGGFATVITRAQDGTIHITEKAPGPNDMVKMVLTTPFKIVAVPVEADKPVTLVLDTSWVKRLRPYRVSSGELSVTGGFAGISKKAHLSGHLSVMRAAALATFFFEVQADGNKKERYLRDVASGSVDPSGRVTISRLESAALTGAIESPFRATGLFTDNESNLSLKLETVPSPHVSDNFAATASLKAVATGPPPANTAVTGKVMR